MNLPNPAPAAGTLPPARQDDPFRRLVETVDDYAIFLLDASGHVASWNRGAERIKGYAPAEIIGRHFSVFYPRAALDKGWPEHELETARRVGRFEDEGWRLRKDGTRFWANVVITAIRGDDGLVVAFSKITRDLTERRMNEERLRESEERFRMLVENVRDYAIFMLDVEGRVLTWNAGAQRLKGYAAGEIIGRHFSTFYPAEYLERDLPGHELREAQRTGRFEHEGWRLRRDGSRFWANVIITAVRDARGELRGYAKVTRDLTERRIREDRLRRSEERFRLLLEGVEDYAIIMLDASGRVTSWNTGAERIMGYRADEAIGRSFEVFFTPEDVAAGRPAEELRQATLHRRSEDRGWRLRKDGTRFWADVIVTSLTDADGRLRGFAKVTRDMSDRKRMEDLEEQGRHLTEFLAMLAHELRNPLAPIRNALAILSMGGELPARAAWARDVIERQALQLTRLVDDLLDVSRITRGKLRMRSESMDLRTAVHRALEAARPLIDARRHALDVHLPGEAVTVHGDITRLTQVVLNLLTNAAKYTPEGGHIALALEPGAHEAVLVVRDNGMGIPPELQERVFDLFAQGERTLDRSEGGLGIGLTLVRRIVTLHGGSIVARSEGAGRGAEFEVRLPLMPTAEQSAPAREIADDAAREPARRQSILIVDDNHDAAESLAALLRMVGHEVDVEHDGEAALRRVGERVPGILLLDIGLPGINGHEVARRLRERPDCKGMRIFALTGFGRDDDRRRSAEAGFDGHLVKPVMPGDIFALLGEPLP